MGSLKKFPGKFRRMTEDEVRKILAELVEFIYLNFREPLRIAEKLFSYILQLQVRHNNFYYDYLDRVRKSFGWIVIKSIINGINGKERRESVNKLFRYLYERGIILIEKKYSRAKNKKIYVVFYNPIIVEFIQCKKGVIKSFFKEYNEGVLFESDEEAIDELKRILLQEK